MTSTSPPPEKQDQASEHVEHGPKILGPGPHLLTGEDMVQEKIWDHTMMSLFGPEFLGPRSAGGMECRSEPGPETPGGPHGPRPTQPPPPATSSGLPLTF